jgi:4-hydroxybenzoate polyprenyltransferase
VAERAELSLDRNPHLCPANLNFDHTATHSSRNAPKYSVARLYGKEKRTMLWTIFLVLLVLWLVGFIGFHVVAWYIHILLVIALVVLVIQLIGGRRAI